MSNMPHSGKQIIISLLFDWSNISLQDENCFSYFPTPENKTTNYINTDFENKLENIFSVC